MARRLEPISKLISAAIGYKIHGSAVSPKRVLDVPQHASEPFSPQALPMDFSLDFAKKAGMPDVFAHGMLSMAYLGRMLTNWQPQAKLRKN